MIGFVGHRDLTGFEAESDLTARLRQVFRTLVAEGRAGGLIGGYASRADQLAVRVWNDLALPTPRLVFPFVETLAGRGSVYHTVDPATATLESSFPEATLAKIGRPSLPDNGVGHAAQAATILARTSVLVAIVDEARKALPGGTVHTVSLARAAGRWVIVIGPKRSG